METRYIDSKIIRGISVKTTHVKASNTDQIPGLWKRFDQNVKVDYKSGHRVYGVYYDYASDASGEFTVLAGTDQPDCNSKIELKEARIEAEDYLVFHDQGTMPELVTKIWCRIWDYFANENSEYTRSYRTDFEHYLSENEIRIHISIKETPGFQFQLNQ